MPPRPSVSRQLLELAEDARAAALAVARENQEITPSLRRLDDATRALLTRLGEMDQDRLDATYLLAQGVLSTWRRYARDTGIVGTDGAA